MTSHHSLVLILFPVHLSCMKDTLWNPGSFIVSADISLTLLEFMNCFRASLNLNRTYCCHHGLLSAFSCENKIETWCSSNFFPTPWVSSSRCRLKRKALHWWGGWQPCPGMVWSLGLKAAARHKSGHAGALTAAWERSLLGPQGHRRSLARLLQFLMDVCAF